MIVDKQVDDAKDEVELKAMNRMSGKSDESVRRIEILQVCRLVMGMS